MRFIPTKVHGILDYLYVLILFFIPTIFHFSTNGAPTLTIDVVSSTVLVYSTFTKYELGISKYLPMKIHLLLDVIVGIFLAASPWIFGFARNVYTPHLFFGLFAVVAALLTKKSSEQIDKSTYAPTK
jgi:SPW repeat-containing protein